MIFAVLIILCTFVAESSFCIIKNDVPIFNTFFLCHNTSITMILLLWLMGKVGGDGFCCHDMATYITRKGTTFVIPL